jgi:hypothetical protein
MSTSDRDRRHARPIAIYPEELTAAVLKPLIDRGEVTVHSSMVTEVIPRFLAEKSRTGGPLFSLDALSYRVMPHGASSQTVDEFFEFLRLESLVAHYNPTTLTDRGIEYLEKVLKEFCAKHPEAAAEVARVLGLRIGQLCS